MFYQYHCKDGEKHRYPMFSFKYFRHPLSYANRDLLGMS